MKILIYIDLYVAEKTPENYPTVIETVSLSYEPWVLEYLRARGRDESTIEINNSTKS